MGYTTDFSGSFKFDKPLTPEQVAYLQRFNQSRRFKRNPEVLKGMPDPLREAVGLPIGPEGCFYVGPEDDNFGQDKDASTVDYNRPPSEQPGLWCQWTVNDEGTELAWDEGEKFYEYVEWLRYLISHFFEKWGIKLTGEVHWQGEDSDDRGTIYVKDNKVEALTDEIHCPKPSWEE
jgi:hypothetical protein